MPTPRIYRVDPRDLQKNIAIGVGLPFNKPSAFKSTYSTKEQVKYNLINLLLTNKGERIENPEFGCDIKKSIFDFINNEINVAAAPTKIGKHCWLGHSASVMPGIVLGDFTLVGAGAVVTKSFEEGYCVIAGNPAKIIRQLDKTACIAYANSK